MAKNEGDSTNSTFSLHYLNEVADGNQEFIKEMIDIFLEDMPKFMQEIVECTEDENFDCVQRLAHKSKSMAGYIMAEDLQEKFKTLESIASADDIVTEDVEILVSQLDDQTSSIVAKLKDHF